MNIVVTGTLGYDYIMDFPGKFTDRIMADKIHKISLSFLVNKLDKNFGGTAGNIAYSLSLLKLNPTILSSAGKDFEEYKKFLISKNISTKNIYVDRKENTSSYFVVTDQDDNQIGSFYLGASKNNKKLSVKTGDFVVIAPNTPEAMMKYVDECQKSNIPYLFDPAFQIDNLSAEDLKMGISKAAIFIANDYEIALTEKKIKKMNCPIIITTLGSKGSIIEKLKEKIVIKPAKVKNTCDPTGAGDAYRAGFLAGYLKGLDLKTCGQMGSVAAAYTVEKYGTMTHHYTIIEFCKRYFENYHEKLRF